MDKKAHLYLNAVEAKVIQMGLARLMDDLKLENQGDFPFTPQARNHIKEICQHARSAANKIEKITGIAATLPPFLPGDENEFFTKQS